MNVRSYERYTLFYFMVIIFLLFLFTFAIYTLSFKIYEYVSIDGVINGVGLVEAVVSKEELNCLYKNKYIYFEGKKVKFKLEEVVLDFLSNKNKVYSKVLIHFNYGNKINGGEIIEFSVKNKKVPFIKIYEVIWKGE